MSPVRVLSGFLVPICFLVDCGLGSFTGNFDFASLNITSNPKMCASVLRAAILEVVDNQLRENTPPATRLTFERLQREGHSVSKAKEMIAAIVAAEFFHITEQKQTFNETRFVERLDQLPDMPWTDEEGD
jgi:hypothetical protein